MNTGLDLKREQDEQDGTEYKFGATSTPCIADIPVPERLQYLPRGELQKGAEDFQDCVTRGYLNILETKFNYLYQTGKMKPGNKTWLEDNGYIQGERVTFSDRFIAMKSGTTRQGNSMKAPVQAVHEHGLIPKALLPAKADMTFDQYHNKAEITAEMEELGQQFLRRFPVAYDQVYLNDMEIALKSDMLNLAGYAWPTPINGEYPAQPSLPLNHAFMGFGLPKTYIFDNYLDNGVAGDWVKKLADNYVFFSYGYRVYIPRETTAEELAIQQTVFEVLKEQGLLAFFAEFVRRFIK